MDQAELSKLKIGDILLFNSDNRPYHGVYISYVYRQTAYTDSYGKSGYYTFKVHCFESRHIEIFYDVEFVKNLTG